MALRSSSINDSTTNPTLNSTNTVSQGRSSGTPNNSLGVSEGQVLKGTVTDVRGNQVTIQMEDGTTFTGSLPEASQFSIGQKASFQVTSTSFKTIYMKALTQAFSMDEDEMVFKALEEANLPKSPRNSELVRSLLNNQQSVSRQNILDSLKLCAEFPDNSVDAVITMRNLNMPLTKEMITQFENYQNQTHQLLFKMDTLADSMNQVINLLGNSSPDVGKVVADQLLSLALEPSLDQPLETTAPQTFAPATEEFMASLPSTLFAPDGTPLLSAEQNAKLTLLAPEELATINLDENGTLQIQLTGSEEATPLLSHLDTLSLPASETPISYDKGQVGFTLTEEQRIEFTKQIKDLPISESTKLSILEGTASNHEVLAELQKILPELSATNAKELLTSHGFQSLLKQQFVAGLTIRPDTLKEDGSLEKLYGKMERQFTALSRFQDQIFSQKEFQNLGNSASDMRQNLQFMKTMGDAFTYLQLPVNLKEQNAHGDLYVMTRKESLKKNPDNLKVLLHLDMDHLGPLDIHITKERTNVSAKFYVDDKSTANLLKRNLELLSDAINEQGYSFQGEALPHQESFDVVTDFMAQDVPLGSMQRYSFDLRA